MADQFLPSTLNDFLVFFVDESWGGTINEVTLPDIDFKTETLTGSGTGGEKEKVLPILKPMKPKLKISDISPKILALIGSKKGREEPLIFKGDIDRDGASVQVKITMQGDWFKASKGTMATGGQEATMEVDGSLNFYSIEIDGKPSLYVDIINKVYKPDGQTDEWADIRKNIGKA